MKYVATTNTITAGRRAYFFCCLYFIFIFSVQTTKENLTHLFLKFEVFEGKKIKIKKLANTHQTNKQTNKQTNQQKQKHPILPFIIVNLQKNALF